MMDLGLKGSVQDSEVTQSDGSSGGDSTGTHPATWPVRHVKLMLCASGMHHKEWLEVVRPLQISRETLPDPG